VTKLKWKLDGKDVKGSYLKSSREFRITLPNKAWAAPAGSLCFETTGGLLTGCKW